MNLHEVMKQKARNSRSRTNNAEGQWVIQCAGF